jgi:hypothetical protein
VNEQYGCFIYVIDPRVVASIARRISKAAKEAEALGLAVFGGSGSGTLRYHMTDAGGTQTEVAWLDGCWDGGDGGDDY